MESHLKLEFPNDANLAVVQLALGSPLSLLPECRNQTGCYTHLVFICVLGIQISDFMLVWQAISPPSVSSTLKFPLIKKTFTLIYMCLCAHLGMVCVCRSEDNMKESGLSAM